MKRTGKIFIAIGIVSVLLLACYFVANWSRFVVENAKIQWTVNGQGTFEVDDEIMLIESYTKPAIVAINLDNGNKIWEWLNADYSGESFYLKCNDTIYVTCKNKNWDTAYVFAINKQTGKNYWKTPLHGTFFNTKPLTEAHISDSLIFIAGPDKISCLNRFSGANIYMKDIEDTIDLTTVLTKPMSSYLFFDDGTRILDITASKRFCRNGNMGFTIYPPGIAGDTNFYNLSDTLYAINWRTNKSIWKRKVPGAVNCQIVGTNSTIAFSSNITGKGRLDVWSKVTGKLIWASSFTANVSPPHLILNKLYIGDTSGKLYCYNVVSGELQSTLRLPSPCKVNSDCIQSSKESIYVHSETGEIYAIRQ